MSRMTLKFDYERLWLTFATGNTSRYIDATAIMDMAQSLGGNKCTALPAFHALTGCDVTSSFGRRGKTYELVCMGRLWRFYTIERLMKIMYEL